MYSVLSQGLSLYLGTVGSGLQGWASFRSVDLEIAHLAGRCSSLQRCGTFCTPNNGRNWGAGKWGAGRAAQGRERSCEKVAPPCTGGLDLPKTRAAWKLRPSAALQRIGFWDETMSCGLHVVKMEETSDTDPVWEMTQLSVPGTVANYFPLSEVGGCQRLHQSSLI